MTFAHFLAAAAALTLAVAAQAEAPVDHAAHHDAAASAVSAAAPATDGEVRRIDTAQGRITLKHGPIVNLDMPGMTMVFRVADPAMLEGLKAGDKVKFTADNLNGALTVTAIDVVK